MITVEIANRQKFLALNRPLLVKAIRTVLKGEGVLNAEISLAVVDDRTIRRVNRHFLDHDYATDVLTFVLELNEERLEAELVVSAQTAARVGPEHSMRPKDELLLYVVHGTLHVAGYNDTIAAEAKKMRRLESRYLKELGVSGHGQAVSVPRNAPKSPAARAKVRRGSRR